MRTVLLAIVAASLTGCVSRRLTVRSDPPGALVEVDGEAIGFTPVSVDFDYYATRDFRLSLAGYETLDTQQKIRPPWYQVPPLDFISDNFLLGNHVTDRHELFFRLQRQRVEAGGDLLNRANQVRTRARGG